MWTRYSDEQRASVLAVLDANKGNLSKTSRETGVPKSTLLAWRDNVHVPPPDELRTVKTMELKDLIRAELDAIFEAMPGKRGDATYKDVTTAAGILIDKLALLNGDATSRIEIDGNLSLLTDAQLLRIAAGGGLGTADEA